MTSFIIYSLFTGIATVVFSYRVHTMSTCPVQPVGSTVRNTHEMHVPEEKYCDSLINSIFCLPNKHTLHSFKFFLFLTGLSLHSLYLLYLLTTDLLWFVLFPLETGMWMKSQKVGTVNDNLLAAIYCKLTRYFFHKHYIYKVIIWFSN